MYTFEELVYLNTLELHNYALEQYKLYYVASKMVELKYPSDTNTRDRLILAKLMLGAAGNLLVEAYNSLIPK
jgi:hypothetical protein